MEPRRRSHETYIRAHLTALEGAIRKWPQLMHILVGARQTGKSTAAEQLAARWTGPVVSASADAPDPPGAEWISHHWNLARKTAKKRTVLLIIDEVQKIRGWSDAVKALWEEDRRKRRSLRVLLLGSSSLLIQKNIRETLAGRFALHRSPHWSFRECREAFGWDLDRWIHFGGYPGTVRMLRDQPFWRAYVSESLMESAIARDVLALGQVSKPALLRNLFGVACAFPAQIVSYNEMLGTLQDAGNTVTLSHYLHVLGECFLISGLEKHAAAVRSKGSSPKIVVWNNALISAHAGLSFKDSRADCGWWGRLVENAVGAHLLNHLSRATHSITYWRERDDEVDYIVSLGRKRWAIEVKSGRSMRPRGLGAFQKLFPGTTPVIIGSGGMDLEEFFLSDPRTFFA